MIVSHRPSLRGHGLIILAFLALVVTRNVSVQAGPVTFRFDAEINTVFEGIPFDSGIQFSVGDVVTGKFTFDPSKGSDVDISYSAVQEHQFQLEINGAEFAIPAFLLTARNDAPISDFPFASLIDGLEISGVGLSASFSSPNIDPSQSGVQMYLQGPADVINSAAHPGIAAIWNSLTFERQLLVFLGSADGGAIGFQSTIGPFDSVPEPPTAVICTLLLSIVFVRRIRGVTKE